MGILYYFSVIARKKGGLIVMSNYILKNKHSQFYFAQLSFLLPEGDNFLNWIKKDGLTYYGKLLYERI